MGFSLAISIGQFCMAVASSGRSTGYCVLCVCVFIELWIYCFPDHFQVEMTQEDTKDPPLCLCPSSHRTSGLRSIADLLNAGAVCGVPTDTVYALAASCKQPEAIEKIYRIKVQTQQLLLSFYLELVCLSVNWPDLCECVKGMPFALSVWSLAVQFFFSCEVHK